MSQYGQIIDSKQSVQEFRVDLFFGSMRSINFGNSGVPTKLQDHLLRDRKGIEDIFMVDDSLYILPKSKQSAKYLFDVVMDGCSTEDDGEDDDGMPLADDISWVKMGDRYWLSLWWD